MQVALNRFILNHEVKNRSSEQVRKIPSIADLSMKKHPKLAKKLKLLYQLKASPNIANNRQLADVLGVTRQSVSKWGTGGRTGFGDAIPDAHFFPIGRIFGIDSYLFTLEFEEFEKEVRLTLEWRNRAGIRRAKRIFSSSLPVSCGGGLFGREDELRMLDGAWNQHSVNCVEVSGIGGCGKSTLVNEWLRRMDRDGFRDAEIVFVWSFDKGYGSHAKDSTSTEFLRQALEFLGRAAAPDDDLENQAIRLVQLIRKKRTLLVLDGIQNLQCTYGPHIGRIEDPVLALLVRELTKENLGLCLLTTRLKSVEFETCADARVLRLEVAGLSDEQAVKLLISRDVQGEPQQLAHAVRQHQGLPLTLGLLAEHLGMIAEGRLAHYMEMAPLLEESGEIDSVASLGRDYLAMLPLPGQRKFISLLSLYKRPASLREILKTCANQSLDGLSDEINSLTQTELRYGISALKKVGILRVLPGKRGGTLELDPFVREAIALDLKQSSPELWRGANRMLFDSVRLRRFRRWPTSRQWEKLYFAVIDGICAGSWDDAFALYFQRIRRDGSASPRPGFNYLDQSCLRAFFRDPWSRVEDSLANESSQIDLQLCAAFNLGNLGDIDQAIALSQNSLQWYLDRNQWNGVFTAGSLFLSMMLVLGKMPEAARWAKHIRGRLALADDTFAVARGDMLVANIWFLRGRGEKARKLFQRADRMLAAVEPLPEPEVSMPMANYYFYRFLLETGAFEASLRRHSPGLASHEAEPENSSPDSDRRRHGELSISGLLSLRRGDWENAKRSLDLLVENSRSTSEWLCLAAGLNSRARFFVETGSYPEARADLEEALGISERMGAVAFEWESLLNLATLCSRESRLRSGGEFLERAKNIAQMEGFRFRDREIRELELLLAA